MIKQAMHPLVKKTAEFIKREQLLSADEKVMVAISGGLDSVVLTHVLIELGYQPFLAHYNYRLRGADSDGDASFVKELAAELNCAHGSQSSSAEEIAKLKSGNLQAEARKLRYDWLLQIAQKENCTAICTAHHLDDNLETVLLQLTRGTSITGLTGMSPKLDNGIIRPLLHATRKDLETYARDHQLCWREDQTNATDQYNRNYLRHHVTPRLLSLQTDGNQRLAQTFDRLRTDKKLFLAGLESLWQQALVSPDVLDRKALPKNQQVAQELLYYKLRGYGFKGDHFRQMLEAGSGTTIEAVGGDSQVKIKKELLELILNS